MKSSSTLSLTLGCSSEANPVTIINNYYDINNSNRTLNIGSEFDRVTRRRNSFSKFSGPNFSLNEEILTQKESNKSTPPMAPKVVKKEPKVVAPLIVIENFDNDVQQESSEKSTFMTNDLNFDYNNNGYFVTEIITEQVSLSAAVLIDNESDTKRNSEKSDNINISVVATNANRISAIEENDVYLKSKKKNKIHKYLPSLFSLKALSKSLNTLAGKKKSSIDEYKQVDKSGLLGDDSLAKNNRSSSKSSLKYSHTFTSSPTSSIGSLYESLSKSATHLDADSFVLKVNNNNDLDSSNHFIASNSQSRLSLKQTSIDSSSYDTRSFCNESSTPEKQSTIDFDYLNNSFNKSISNLHNNRNNNNNNSQCKSKKKFNLLSKLRDLSGSDNELKIQRKIKKDNKFPAHLTGSIENDLTVCEFYY